MTSLGIVTTGLASDWVAANTARCANIKSYIVLDACQEAGCAFWPGAWGAPFSRGKRLRHVHNVWGCRKSYTGAIEIHDEIIVWLAADFPVMTSAGIISIIFMSHATSILLSVRPSIPRCAKHWCDNWTADCAMAAIFFFIHSVVERWCMRLMTWWWRLVICRWQVIRLSAVSPNTLARLSVLAGKRWNRKFKAWIQIFWRERWGREWRRVDIKTGHTSVNKLLALICVCSSWYLW